MPAPKFLAGLPKPVLFGLYGAVGGLLGALVFGEPLWRLLKPPAAPEPPPQVAAIAIAVPPDLVLYKRGTSKFTTSVARRNYDGPVDVTVGPLPAGVTFTAKPIDAEKVEVTLAAAAEAVVGNAKLTVTA